MRRVARIALAVILALVLVFAIALAAFAVIYSPTYMFRWLAWQDADVGDHARFPSRPVASAPEPYAFESADDPEASAQMVRDALEQSSSVGADADAFLEETGTQAFIVIRDDVVLYERYFGDFARESIATSFSVAKSYLSALVGIAIGEGHIGSADDAITEYLPELLERDARFGEITIRHLLDMTSGLRYEEFGLPWADDALTYYFDDLAALALERTEIDEAPGKRWQYTNYNPLLLGLILERTTGTSVAEYLETRIWARIGTEFDASWSLDHEGGLEKLESGINGRAIDFAKLGRLYLDGGRWEGEQVVPADWVERSIHPAAGHGDGYYPPSMESAAGTISHAMYWWRLARSDGDEAYSALGNHGQLVFVSPADRLIVVRFGERYGIRSFEWLGAFATLADNLDD